MKIRIVDKKKFVKFVTAVVFVATSLFYGAYLLIIKFEHKNEVGEIESKKENFANDVTFTKDETSKGNIQEGTNNADAAVEEETSVVEYENTTYKYALTFPEKWFMNNDDSGSILSKIKTEDGVQLVAGGQTFWSNYQNINDYDPQNKPDDFRLLSLTIYQDPAKNVDEFAKKIGFENDLAREEFEAEKIKGVQFVAQGIFSKNPRIVVLFQKGDKFFVFRPAFLNGDTDATDSMELIVKSFSFTD